MTPTWSSASRRPASSPARWSRASCSAISPPSPLRRKAPSSPARRVRRLETATVSEDQGGFVRVLNQGCGWGIASFTSLDELPAMVARANELSRAVRLDEPIRLAETPPEVGDAVLELDGDVRGI